MCKKNFRLKFSDRVCMYFNAEKCLPPVDFKIPMSVVQHDEAKSSSLALVHGVIVGVLIIGVVIVVLAVVVYINARKKLIGECSQKFGYQLRVQ